VTLFAFSDNRKREVADDWLAYHAHGFYDGSPGIERYLAWRVGDELQSVESLGPQLHRPDRIEAALKPQPPMSRAEVAPDHPLLIPSAGSPIAVARGGTLAADDVNGDGCGDLVLLVGKNLSVFFGGVDGAWPPEPDIKSDLSAEASELVLADLNGDSKQDIVFADHDRNDVAVMLGTGDGHFKPVKGSPFVAFEGTQPHTHGLAVADVNGDGHVDIVMANNNDGDLALLLGDGKGTFARAPKSPFSCGKSPYPIAVSDINSDGCADVVVPNAAHDNPELQRLTVLLGNPNGELKSAPFSPLKCDATVWYAATGDLNGDKQPDIVATHTEGHSGATVLISSGQGTFVPAPLSPLQFGHGAWGVEIADMNRDGKGDLVVAADEHIQVFLGDGQGAFHPASGSPFKIGKGGWRLAVADFNGDGKLDVASKCVESNHIAILSGN
jgi:hypothetical protein